MDVFRRELPDGSRDQAGAYFAIGGDQGRVTHFDGSQGNSNFNAYSFGGYWTHFGTSGWYTDMVLQGTYYDINSSANRGLPALRTVGQGLATSVEARPVIRQALDRLRKDGLVKSRRGSGTFVKQRHPRNVQNLNSVEKIGELIENLEFRMLVEPASAFLAAQRRSDSDLNAMKLAVEEYNEVAVVNRGVGHHLDFAFHLAVATATANRRIVAGVRMVEFDIDHGVNLVRYLENYDHYERSKLVFAEPSRIFKAIESQDADAAKAAMRNHLELARIRMMKVQPGRGRPER